MLDMPIEEYRARQAYDAYGAVTDHKNYQGLPMPEWSALTEKIQEAWRAATTRVMQTPDPDMAERFKDVQEQLGHSGLKDGDPSPSRNDLGQLRTVVEAIDGRVVMYHGTNISWMGMSQLEALELIKTLQHKLHEAAAQTTPKE